MKQENEHSDDNLSTLLGNLLGYPKARSLAGWIWESRFARISADKSSNISAELRFRNNSNPEVLLAAATSSIDFFEFDDINGFKVKAGELFHQKEKDDFAAFGKARSDSRGIADNGCRKITILLQGLK